jgi:protocatechuate 3,4-dioxygenase alpha subunit
MSDPLLMSEQTPSQTVGPFFHNALIVGNENVLVNEHTQGERIIIEGRVLDGEGMAVPDAIIELWQADGNGYSHHPTDPHHASADPHFRGFGRADTVNDGRYRFVTIMPGPVLFDAEHTQARHLNLRVFARGMLIHAITRLYFADDPTLADDPVLNLVPESRRPTLLATRIDDESRLPHYRFDIHLQGENETVFFNP